MCLQGETMSYSSGYLYSLAQYQAWQVETKDLEFLIWYSVKNKIKQQPANQPTNQCSFYHTNDNICF